MQQNSFQKNGMLNVNTNNANIPSGQLGRRSIQSIRDDMLEAKTRNNPINKEQTLNNNSNFNSQSNTNYRQRVEDMKNFNRWK